MCTVQITNVKTENSINCKYFYNYELNQKQIKQIHLNTKTNLKSDHLHSDDTDLITALTRGGCYYQVKGETKDAVFDEVENLFALTTSFLAKQLKQREQLSATGIGKGFAIPHPQYPKWVRR